MRIQSSKSRAFSLIELMMVFCVLTIAFTIIIPMLNWSVKTTAAAQHQAAMALRFDGSTAALRADIYQAITIQLETPRALILREPDGSQVHWTIGSGDRLARSSQQDRKRQEHPTDELWTDLGITSQTTFERDGLAIRLIIPPRPDGSRKTLLFFAQTAAFTGGKP